MTNEHEEEWPWIELSREDASEAWLRRYVENDPADLPGDARVFVRRLADGGHELRIDYADGHSANLRDLRGDETPDELRTLFGIGEHSGEWIELSREEGLRWLGPWVEELLPIADARLLVRVLDSGGYEVAVEHVDGTRTTIRHGTQDPDSQ